MTAPKRSNERAGHHGKASLPDQVETFNTVPVPSARAAWLKSTKDFYAALAESGQSRFYEPSDWQHALVTCDALDAFQRRPRPSSEMFKALLAAMNDLGVTEASRRRLHIEVNRPDAPEEPKGEGVADALAAIRERRAAGAP